MKWKRTLTAFLVLALLSCSLPTAFASDKSATRGEVVQALLTAADDYNPSVEKTDIIKGYEDGELHEERSVTRAEALVMLKRAFGELPKPTGHNARAAIPAGSFTDIPDWARTELSNVFDAGIVAGTAEGILSPDEPVAMEQMNLFIRRVYALFGTNEKDDFYAAVNREALNALTIKPGRTIAGTLYDLNDSSAAKVSEIIKEVTSSAHPKGTKEQKIADFYKNVKNMDARNKAGITPIKEHLELIDTAKSVGDLIDIQSTLSEKIGVAPFLAFNLSIDMKDSTKYMLSFGTSTPSLQKEVYADKNSPQAKSYIKYMEKLFVLGGETAEDAAAMADKCFDMEAVLAAAMMNREDYGNVDKLYHIFTMQQIQELFPEIDINKVFSDSGLSRTDRIIIADVGLTEAFSSYFTNGNTDSLKAYAKLSLLTGWGGALNQEFMAAAQEFNKEFLGTEGGYTAEEYAALTVQSTMPDYIGEIYAQKYFTEEAKKDVEKMVKDIVAVYRRRIQNISWMSDTTKEKALNKLDHLGVKIGYPDNWETALDHADIKSAEEGGSYFENALSILAAQKQERIGLQNQPVDKTKWAMYPFTVNACYVSTSNDITFPAAILQAPMYDVNASYEQNLGAIGYIIAHEITHAFDNNGAKFDENGNAADWWTKEDYEAFQQLCGKMTAFYDGQEGVPGILMNGSLTLSENVADQGAAACVTEIAAGLENPDFKTLYRSMAKCWASTASRAYYQYASQMDVHSVDKLRVNRVVVNFDEFYEAFGIGETDGMYVRPEDRVKIW